MHANVNCSHTVLVLLLFLLLLIYETISYSICCSGVAVYACVYCSPTRDDLLIDVPIVLNWFALYLPLSDFLFKNQIGKFISVTVVYSLFDYYCFCALITEFELD